jgi:seryl-tRNA(Sec) selenium transferase
VYFPDSRKASILAVVRHISLVNGTMYKVGTEIVNIDPIGEVHYSDYIDVINQRSTALDGSDAAG